ncbi:MAG TPA: hypothetical protein VNH44_11835 [Micropepsaceae bacterium]|nr:hypothetical protein [Micropepsaceae bacterium]
MNKTILLSAIAVTLAGAGAVLAAQAPPAQPMSFFVTSTTPTGSGNLGGLAGADKICQDLAAAAGAGNKTWHAYLSTQPANGMPGVNARGRIGAGPWYNAKGVMIADSVADLHGDNQRDRNNVQKANMLTEKGELIKGFGDMPNEHDILTGSDSDGRAFPAGLDTTCNNWTADGTDHKAMLGHADRQGGGNVSWNSVHMSADCTKAGLIRTGGAGHLYCFAIN